MAGFDSRSYKTATQNAISPDVGDPEAPGYKYDIKTHFLSTRKRQATFSLGARRDEKGKNGLINLTATPINIGPNSYAPRFTTTSQLKSAPKVGFTGDSRFGHQNRLLRMHETYYTYSCLGSQVSSAKLTENKYSFGRFERMSKHGNTASARILKVSLPHAVY